MIRCIILTMAMLLTLQLEPRDHAPVLQDQTWIIRVSGASGSHETHDRCVMPVPGHAPEGRMPQTCTAKGNGV